MEKSTADELMDEVRRLDENERQRVLAYARSLSDTPPRGVPGKALLEFSGAWRRDLADEIAEAIDEGCEQVNLDAW